METWCIPKLWIFKTVYIINILYGIIFHVCVILVQTLSTVVDFVILIHFTRARSIHIEMTCYLTYIWGQLVLLLVVRQIYHTFFGSRISHICLNEVWIQHWWKVPDWQLLKMSSWISMEQGAELLCFWYTSALTLDMLLLIIGQV